MADSKEITVDILFGLGSKPFEALAGMAEGALLAAFKTAGNLQDLATRLVIPIQLITVTGAKVVAAHGYDAYKITIAIRSDDPNAVAKEIFSTGVGLAATAISGPIARFGLSLTPLSPIGGTVAGTLVGVGVGAIASGYR